FKGFREVCLKIERELCISRWLWPDHDDNPKSANSDPDTATGFKSKWSKKSNHRLFIAYHKALIHQAPELFECQNDSRSKQLQFLLCSASAH
ncbi:hypothetical protein, partial [Ralstonia solanacearum]|uniref:hypothetical protein n=1 Tax=Ralstonia solanacearum TaxID=305 RepID=UPI001E3AF62E